MAARERLDMPREVIGIFQDAGALEAAIDEILSAGFDRADLSFLASEEAVEAKLGHRYRRTDDLADDPAAPRVAYVSTEAVGDAEGALIGGLFYIGAAVASGAVVASGGTLAAVIAAAALAGGGGGVIGSLLANRVGRHHANYLHEQLDRGGLLLWVDTSNSAREQVVLEILRKHSAQCVHIHGRSIEPSPAS
jgi:hypothetical protein